MPLTNVLSCNTQPYGAPCFPSPDSALRTTRAACAAAYGAWLPIVKSAAYLTDFMVDCVAFGLVHKTANPVIYVLQGASIVIKETLILSHFHTRLLTEVKLPFQIVSSPQKVMML